VYFLWHCSSPHGVRPLTGILLYGARTFLPFTTLLLQSGDCLASFRANSNTLSGQAYLSEESVVVDLPDFQPLPYVKNTFI